MLADFHIHSTFCDGKNTPEEMVIRAIESGLCSMGFSSHAYTNHDLHCCVKDVDGYITEIKRLKQKYAHKIQIYLGTEEDRTAFVERDKYDYIIGSNHYATVKNKHYPIDSNYSYFTSALKLFNDDELKLAEHYFSTLCEYIQRRKPDIIGHFDVISKFDEKEQCRFLHNEKYWEIAEYYTRIALNTGCIFEVNTGYINRGWRSSPCPDFRLLGIIAKEKGKIVLSSDSHNITHLAGHFDEMKHKLKDIGFKHTYALFDNKWTKFEI
ncbi:MAG: histidinol-phosphatase HisJ family protein [Clostridia bacterium]|nr:histidinol-phosphatase HisJ family protein [Clostridia bacterium]